MEQRDRQTSRDREIVRIVETYSDMLTRIALNRVNSIAEAEEIVEPWGDYDRDKVDALGKAGVPIHFYSVRQKDFDPGWAADYPLEVILEDGKKVYFVIPGDVSGFPVREMKSPMSTLRELNALLAVPGYLHVHMVRFGEVDGPYDPS